MNCRPSGWRPHSRSWVDQGRRPEHREPDLAPAAGSMCSTGGLLLLLLLFPLTIAVPRSLLLLRDGLGYKIAFRRQSLRWADRYGHFELRRSLSLKDSARGWHIRVVASDGGTDMTPGGEQVVGRVEADPAQAGKPGLHPGMRRPVTGTVPILASVVQVSAHVASRDPHAAEKADEDVGEVLTDTLTAGEGLFNR